MEKSFWTERWQQQQIGFHQTEINQYLQKYWHVARQQPHDRTVFVPLCGKSGDMLWLKEQGHSVLGIEFSDIAVKDFFTENRLEPEHYYEERYSRHVTDDITLLCGDFFMMQAADLNECHLVFDRASLVAMPQAMRKNYAQHMKEILPESVRMLLVTMEYPQDEMDGPPFSVPEAEVFSLYQDDFHIKKLQTFDIFAENPRFKAQGLTSLQEKVFLLSRK